MSLHVWHKEILQLKDFALAGDEQFEVYRRMRNYVNGDWEGYHPRTNVMVRYSGVRANCYHMS